MNRLLQLEAFLRSMKKEVVDWEKYETYILYKYTSEDFQFGYDVVRNWHNEFKYVRETNLTDDLKLICELNKDTEFIGIFCDDNIWKDSFNVNCTEFDIFKKDNQICCLSLRMHPKISKCQTMGNVDTPPPKFNDKPYIWDWTDLNLKGDWKYPMSVDGHVFRTSLINDYLNKFIFSNVSMFESKMAGNSPINQSKMMCFEESKILNIPLNRVTTTTNNINMGVEPEFLNDKFLDGNIINTDYYYKFQNVSPHQEVKLKWKKYC